VTVGAVLLMLAAHAGASATVHRLTLKVLSAPRMGAKFSLLVLVDVMHPRALGVFTDTQACPPAALDMPTQPDYSGAITTGSELRFSKKYEVGPLTPNTTLYVCAYLAKVKGHAVAATTTAASLAFTTEAAGPAQVTRDHP